MTKIRSAMGLSAMYLAGSLSGYLAMARGPNESCTKLYPWRNAKTEIKESGSYCLMANTSSEAPSFFSLERGRISQVMIIHAGDVSLDLKGHALDGGAVTGGIVVMKSDGKDLFNISVKNGSISSTGGAFSDGFAPMLVPSDMGDPLEGRYIPPSESSEKIMASEKFMKILKTRMLKTQTERRPKLAADYLVRNVHLENMKISTKLSEGGAGAEGGGIDIEGASTVIRNSVIEVAAGTAIWLFGPNALVENNTIIVHGEGRLRPADAAIRLVQGDGAMIRNNKIIIKDKANRRAISTFDTGAFSFVNNTLSGMSPGDPVGQAFIGELKMKNIGTTYAR